MHYATSVHVWHSMLPNLSQYSIVGLPLNKPRPNKSMWLTASFVFFKFVILHCGIMECGKLTTGTLWNIPQDIFSELHVVNFCMLQNTLTRLFSAGPVHYRTADIVTTIPFIVTTFHMIPKVYTNDTDEWRLTKQLKLLKNELLTLKTFQSPLNSNLIFVYITEAGYNARNFFNFFEFLQKTPVLYFVGHIVVLRVCDRRRQYFIRRRHLIVYTQTVNNMFSVTSGLAHCRSVGNDPKFSEPL